jgi:anthranilate phosphoribosyltransferase
MDDLSMDQSLSNIEIIQVEKAENQSKILANIDIGFFYSDPLISGVHKVAQRRKRLNISSIIDKVKK